MSKSSGVVAVTESEMRSRLMALMRKTAGQPNIQLENDLALWSYMPTTFFLPIVSKLGGQGLVDFYRERYGIAQISDEAVLEFQTILNFYLA